MIKKTERPWIQARMKKDWKTEARAFAIGYQKDRTVYVRKMVSEGKWQVWNGDNRYTYIILTTEQAQEFVQTERSSDGKPKLVGDQLQLDNHFKYMLSN